MDSSSHPACGLGGAVDVGFVFEGLLWLAIIGIVLFIGTLIFGILRQRAKRAKA